MSPARPPSLVTPLLLVVLPVAGGLCTTLGGNHKSRSDWAWLGAGVLLILAAGVWQVARERRQRRQQAEDQTEAVRLRVALKDALQPIAELIAGMPAMSKPARRARLSEVCIQAVGALCLLLKDVDRLRSVVYAVDDAGQSMSVLPIRAEAAHPARSSSAPPAVMLH